MIGLIKTHGVTLTYDFGQPIPSRLLQWRIDDKRHCSACPPSSAIRPHAQSPAVRERLRRVGFTSEIVYCVYDLALSTVLTSRASYCRHMAFALRCVTDAQLRALALGYIPSILITYGMLEEITSTD